MFKPAFTLIRFLITSAVFGTMVSFAVDQASAQDAKTAPAKQEATQFNPKEYLKEDSGIENVKVELAARAGDGWSVRQVQTTNGQFELGLLPAGQYELRFSDAGGQNNTTANRGITINTTHVEYSNAKKAAGNDDPKHNSDVGRVTVLLTGVVGGTLKQELKTDLGSKMGAEVARPGKPKFKHIVVFKADGRSVVKGTLRHDGVMNSIRNMKPQ